MYQMTNVYLNFLESLYDENLRAAWALEGMKFSLMARTGLSDTDALEVCVKIVASSEIAQASQNKAEVTIS